MSILLVYCIKMNKHTTLFLALSTTGVFAQSLTYPIVDTDVSDFYDHEAIISAPQAGEAFYGQDAHYQGNQPAYTDNGNGTVSDNVTGLMWQKDMGVKRTYAEALIVADTMQLAGYTDWRIPTIKELYSLALFTGRCFGTDAVDLFIDTNFFAHPLGDESIGEREIDAQTWTCTPYNGLTMGGDSSIFGYNFVDGRLKAYPKYNPMSGAPTTMYFRMVRGNLSYGVNSFSDNNDGTITDGATGLMWQQTDDGNTHNWEEALAYAENLSLAGHADWRLPNAKELQSIVDYTRGPQASNSAAIDPLFYCTPTFDYYGNAGQYGYYWTSSPLQDGPAPYTDAVYFCFGQANGEMEAPAGSGNFMLFDAHGAGAQRNDPKAGDTASFPDTFGPQGDVRYVFNYVRCVRNVDTSLAAKEPVWIEKIGLYPNPASAQIHIQLGAIYPSVMVTLMDMRGTLIRTLHAEKSNALLMQVADVPRGIYALRIEVGRMVLYRELILE